MKNSAIENLLKEGERQFGAASEWWKNNTNDPHGVNFGAYVVLSQCATTFKNIREKIYAGGTEPQQQTATERVMTAEESKRERRERIAKDVMLVLIAESDFRASTTISALASRSVMYADALITELDKKV